MRSASIALAALAASVGAGSAVAVSASGRQAGRTLTFNVKQTAPQDHAEVDLRPRGLSLGDEDIGAVTLRASGEVAGRAEAVCTITDASFEGRQCVVTLILRDGLITAQDAGVDVPLPGTASSDAAPPDEFAITGGTDSFNGASGTMLIVHGNRGDTFVVELLV